jgi:hypothetical protein
MSEKTEKAGSDAVHMRALRVDAPERVGVSITRNELIAQVGASQASELLWDDWRHDNARSKDWISVARFHDPDKNIQLFSFSALIENSSIQRALETYEWGFDQNIGQPSIISYGRNGDEYHYDDGSTDHRDGISYFPLVYSRYPLQKAPRFQIIEEYELYHDAIWEGDELQCIDDDGKVQVIARQRRAEGLRGIDVERHHLRDFLTAKRRSLIRVHELIRWFDSQAFRGKEQVWITANDDLSTCETLVSYVEYRSDRSLLSKCYVKDIVRPYDGPPRDMRRGEQDHVKFAIGRDEQGSELMASCDGAILDTADGAPFLTRVYFDIGILGKYYAEPQRFSVNPGRIECHGIWGIPIDIVDNKYVQVWLGDLGRIPYSEQLYWRSHNVVVDIPLSDHRYQADILGKWPTSKPPDGVTELHDARERANLASKLVMGEPLFRDLHEGDAHIVACLRVPLTDEPREMDEMILGLTKYLVDSINASALELWSGLKISSDGPIKGSIALLYESLRKAGVLETAAKAATDGLQKAQTLRSSAAAHRRGSSYGKVLAKFGYASLSNRAIVERLIEATKDSLGVLMDCFDALAQRQKNANDQEMNGEDHDDEDDDLKRGE